MLNPAASRSLPSETLEREAHRRGDSEWLRHQLSDSPPCIFVLQGAKLFSVGLQKRPVPLEVPDPEKALNRIFLGVDRQGVAWFAADLSARASEEEALGFLNINTDLARFIPLRHFDGLLLSE